MQTTLITKATFVVGKMQSALGYIVLLLLSAIPLQSIAFLFGGVSEAELILALLVLLVSAIALGAFGMFFSSITERTLAATIRSYTVAIAITVGLPAGRADPLSERLWQCRQQLHQSLHRQSDG